MWDLVTHLLDDSDFYPRWQCGTWSTEHGLLHIIADLGIWSAYVAIPGVLAWFLGRRRDLPFRRLLFLVAAFILACGLTHLLEAAMFWWPAYRLAGVVKLLTALTSWATVVILVPIMPRVLALRSPDELQHEIEQRRHAEQVALTQAQELQKQAALLDLAHDAIFVRDLQGRIAFWNRGAEQMYGYSREQALEQPSHVLLKTEFPLPVEFIEDAVRLSGRWDGELTHTCRDGARLVVASRWALQCDEQGNPQAFLEINSDITRQKRIEDELRRTNTNLDRRVQERTAALVDANVALQSEIQERRAVEAKLKASERIYRAIGESIDYGVWICDHEGRNIYVSPSFLSLVGITQDQCSEFGWGNILHPEDAQRTIAAWKECVRTRGKWDVEHRFRGIDGCWHPVLARGVPVEDEDGKVVYWAGINLDISRLKHAEASLRELNASLEQRVAERSEAAEKRALALAQSEAALRESEEKFRNAFDHAPVGMFLARLDGSWMKINPALCRIVGYSEPELLTIHWTKLTHPDDVAKDKDKAEEVRLGKIAYYHMEKRYIHKDGHIVWIILGGSAVHDARRNPLYFVGHVNDITDLKLALQEKEVLLKEVHHRVKNNLQVISSLLHLQSQHTADPDSTEMFRESQHRVRSMALVHERLYRSADFAEVDFHDYIGSLATYLFQSYRVDADRIHLRVNLHDVRLSIDAAVPCGLLVNELVSNCLKHAFQGRECGCIRIELCPVGEHDVQLAVSDDGIGLPDDIHPETAASFGLELVTALVEQLHGTLQVQRGPGTTISVLFPLAKGPHGSTRRLTLQVAN